MEVAPNTVTLIPAAMYLMGTDGDRRFLLGLPLRFDFCGALKASCSWEIVGMLKTATMKED